eukprot:1139049-Pelagomonas_calceolata.AAC.15
MMYLKGGPWNHAHLTGTPSLYVPPSQFDLSVYSSDQLKGLVSSKMPPGRRAEKACKHTTPGVT